MPQPTPPPIHVLPEMDLFTTVRVLEAIRTLRDPARIRAHADEFQSIGRPLMAHYLRDFAAKVERALRNPTQEGKTP